MRINTNRINALNHNEGDLMKYLLPILGAVMMTGCATGMMSGTGGAFITLGTVEGIAATAHKPGTKTGMACTMNILGIYAAGDAGISTAAKTVGIQNIATVERQYTNYAGIYGKMCTIVTGN